MKKLFGVLVVMLVAFSAMAQQTEDVGYTLPTGYFKMVVYPGPEVESYRTTKREDSYPTPKLYPSRHFQGYYLGWIEDGTDVLDGGWPMWSLDRDRGHLSFGYPYFTYLSKNIPVSDEKSSQIEYIINTGFVGQVATCSDERTKLRVPVTREHVQEAIWSIGEYIPLEGLPCPVDQIVEQAVNRALDWNRCGPRYRLYMLIPSFPWGGASDPSLLLFTLYDEMPCEEEVLTEAKSLTASLEVQ